MVLDQSKQAWADQPPNVATLAQLTTKRRERKSAGQEFVQPDVYANGLGALSSGRSAFFLAIDKDSQQTLGQSSVDPAFDVTAMKRWSGDVGTRLFQFLTVSLDHAVHTFADLDSRLPTQKLVGTRRIADET